MRLSDWVEQAICVNGNGAVARLTLDLDRVPPSESILDIHVSSGSVTGGGKRVRTHHMYSAMMVPFWSSEKYLSSCAMYEYDYRELHSSVFQRS